MRLKQQQTPEQKLPQMLQKTTKTATNAGDFPENVPQLRKFSNKRRRLSGKCSTITQIQQQTPEKKLPQMFHIQKNKKNTTAVNKKALRGAIEYATRQ